MAFGPALNDRRAYTFLREGQNCPNYFSRHEQNFAGGHVSSVLLQSAASFLQGNLCLKVSLQIAWQQFLDLAGKAQLRRVLERSQAVNQNPSSCLRSKIRDAGSAWLACNDNAP